MPEYPKLETQPRPEREKYRGNKLPDVWRNAPARFEPEHNPEIYKIIKSHKSDKPSHLITRFALPSFVAEHPVLVYDKERDVCKYTCHRETLPGRPMQHSVKKHVSEISPEKQHVTCEL